VRPQKGNCRAIAFASVVQRPFAAFIKSARHTGFPHFRHKIGLMALSALGRCALISDELRAMRNGTVTGGGGAILIL
jgi:hypothetical protein